jgi:predicted NUDIX family phosphoesterase
MPDDLRCLFYRIAISHDVKDETKESADSAQKLNSLNWMIKSSTVLSVRKEMWMISAARTKTWIVSVVRTDISDQEWIRLIF